MKTEYGYQFRQYEPTWTTREHAEEVARAVPEVVVVARDISPVRVVSIR